MSTREEKKQAKIERYTTYASNAEQASNESYERSNRLVEHIPVGQPILPGRRGIAHRNTLDKSWNALGKSVKLSEKAEYYRQKAQATADNDAIYTGDDDAEERLTAKIAELEEEHRIKKEINKIAKNKKLSDEEKVKQITTLGFSEQTAQKLRSGLDWYELPYLSANIRRIKQRLEIVKHNNTATDKIFVCGDIAIKTNYKENRLQVFFPGIPDEEIRNKMKHQAFRWSRYNECWQSYLNRWQLDKIKNILKEAYPDREITEATPITNNTAQ